MKPTGVRLVELRERVLNPSVMVSVLLREALMVARAMKEPDSLQWIQAEMNGYENATEVADYRRVKGRVRAWNPYRGWVPLLFQDSEEAQLASLVHSTQSIAEIEHLASQAGSGSELQAPFSHEQEQMLREGMEFNTEITRFVSPIYLTRILEAVRTRLLNWLSDLIEMSGADDGTVMAKAAEADSPDDQQSRPVVLSGRFDHTQINVGPGSQIQEISGDLDWSALGELLDRILESADAKGFDRSEQEELRADITAVRAQINSPRPKLSIIREGLNSVRRIAEQAAGSALATYIPAIVEFTKSLGA